MTSNNLFSIAIYDRGSKSSKKITETSERDGKTVRCVTAALDLINNRILDLQQIDAISIMNLINYWCGW